MFISFWLRPETFSFCVSPQHTSWLLGTLGRPSLTVGSC